MNKIVFLLLLFFCVKAVSGQSEIKPDSLLEAPAGFHRQEVPEPVTTLSLMRMALLKAPDFTPDFSNPLKINSLLFLPDPKVRFSREFTNILSSSFSPFGYEIGLSSSMQLLQQGTFKFNNGMQINVYGDYNSGGWKVPNPLALPWEKNNFRGAFEIKSSNGAFGFRIGVHRGYGYPY